MKLEDKELLAEWMGAEKISTGDTLLRYIFPNNPNALYVEDEFNPDTDPLQFGEVWTKLTPGQQQLVLENTETMDTAEIISALLSKEGLAEFCGYVLEVLKREL
jgi:hypothetical protein